MCLPPVRECQDFTEFTQKKIKIFKETMKIIQKSQDKYVEYSTYQWHKKHKRKKIFKKGDKVLLKNHVKKSKLDPDFLDIEYIIVHINASGTTAVIAPIDYPFDGKQVSCQHLRIMPKH